MVSENICIYSMVVHDDSDIKSGDHIFLAAIGGLEKLPTSFISHAANNHFSKLEMHFTRESLISLNRQFEGPGKRGKLNPKHATKSKVCIVKSQKAEEEKEKYALGYIQLGKPYTINQFIFKLDSGDNKEIATSINPVYLNKEYDPQDVLRQFVEQVKLSGDYLIIEDEELPNEIALFGELDGKWFLGLNNRNQEALALEYIDIIKRSKSAEVKEAKHSFSQVTAHFKSTIDINITYRVAAKMVFNYLAFERGHAFVLQSRFDELRKWIYQGEGENEFVTLIESDNIMKERFGTLYPESAHYIFVTQIDKQLVGIIGFYGAAFSFAVKLADLSPDETNSYDLSGFICDWKNRKEYKLIDYIVEMTEESISIDKLIEMP